MRYAIISDIHANLGALQNVLKDIASHKCSHIACLGDIVGLGDQPKECLDLIRKMDIPCVRGNYDEYCSGECSLENLSHADHIRWTREQLTAEDREWLQALPYTLSVSGFTIVHSTLDKPQKWEYVFDQLAAAKSLSHQSAPVCFYGHTHQPCAFIREGVVKGGSFEKLRVESNRKYFVNAGSVGQPRDGSRQSSYAIYDLDERLIELKRLDCPRSDLGRDASGSPAPVRKPPGGKPPFLSDKNEL